MATLNNASIAALPAHVHRSDIDRSKLKAGIAHFGVGAFHRAHQAFYLDKVLQKNKDLSWGILGVGLLSFDKPLSEAMKTQDSLYTVSEMTPRGECNTFLIQSMCEYVYAPDNWEYLLTRLVDPNIRIVSMTITEGGYLIDQHGKFMESHPSIVKDLSSPTLPQTAFGIIVEALSRRKQAGVPAFTVMSCDNLRHNGDQAKLACLSYARARDPALAKWIEENVSFPNGMVDRITPAMNPELRTTLNARTGINDLAPVVCEDFIQWVLEDNFKNGRPQWEIAGVTMTSNVTPYEEAKIRLLNGSHQMLSYPAFLSGLRRVDIACKDPLFSNYLRDFLNKDSGPFLESIPGMDLDVYKETLLARFANEAIGDQLARLCLDGGSKIPGFLLPTLQANLKKHGNCPRLSFLLAAYNHYIHVGKDDLGQPFELKEPNAMELLKPIIASSSPLTLIENHSLLGDSATYPKFVEEYKKFLSSIETKGCRYTLENFDLVLNK